MMKPSPKRKRKTKCFLTWLVFSLRASFSFTVRHKKYGCFSTVQSYNFFSAFPTTTKQGLIPQNDFIDAADQITIQYISNFQYRYCAWKYHIYVHVSVSQLYLQLWKHLEPGADPTWVQGDSSPPYTQKTHGYPLSTPLNFFTMNNKLKVLRWLEVK